MINEAERLRRWRLILGSDNEDQTMGTGVQLSGQDAAIDGTLNSLYDSDRKGNLASSAPKVATWLGDIRNYFPSSVVRIMQKDAMERLNLRQMLLQPEMLSSIEVDVKLVATLLELKSVMPGKTKETAKIVVNKLVEELEKKLLQKTIQAITGSLNRASRNNRRPLYKEIDWHRTIRANLKNYQPSLHTIIPEAKIGYGKKRSALRDIILCVDQSGSMGTSVVYAGIFGSVLASIKAVNMRLVVFDTAVVDLTAEMSDPVELLFGVQLGGGTDINRALAYCQSLVSRPLETIIILISDLIEGGNEKEMLKRVASLVNGGVQFISLLALNDEGAPSYSHSVAEEFAQLGIPTFACTPDLFPELMAAAINRDNITEWAAVREIPIKR